MTPSEAVAKHGSIRAAARALNLSYATFHARLNGAEPRKPAGHSSDNVLTFPSLPDRREPIDALIARRSEHYARLRDHRDAATWQQIKIASNDPIAICFMGDPHLDDDGCNWPALLDDVARLRETPGMYAVNIGDTTNNWVGRLARLFGNQETSQTSARQLAEWLLIHAGIKWAAVVLGNHDEWNEGGEIIKRMCATSTAHIPVHEWAAKLEFVFPNGSTCRASVAHDFKGRSIYNAAHGLKREAIWHQDGAHVLAAGHIHYGEIGQCELPGGHNPWLIRARGYKDFDPHALVNGYHEGVRFRSPCIIIDPNAPEHERVLGFENIRHAAIVLAAMRSERKSNERSTSRDVHEHLRSKPSGVSGKPSKAKHSRSKKRASSNRRGGVRRADNAVRNATPARRQPKPRNR